MDEVLQAVHDRALDSDAVAVICQLSEVEQQAIAAPSPQHKSTDRPTIKIDSRFFSEVNSGGGTEAIAMRPSSLSRIRRSLARIGLNTAQSPMNSTVTLIDPLLQ